MILATTFGHAERLGGELGRHDVAVVALGQGQEEVGVLGPGPDAATSSSVPSPRTALPANVVGSRSKADGRQVDDDDLVAGPVERLGDGSADAAAADDRRSSRCSSGIASRTTHTAHGAFFRT